MGLCLHGVMPCCTVLSCSVVSDSLWPHGCSLPGSSVHGDSPGKNTGVDCRTLLQRISPTQGLSPGLPHCRQILYQLSHKRSPRIWEWGSLSLLQRIFLTQESNRDLLIAGGFFTKWAVREEWDILFLSSTIITICGVMWFQTSPKALYLIDITWVPISDGLWDKLHLIFFNNF